MILHFAPDQIECALLYDADFSPIDFDALHLHLNTLIQTPGQSFKRAPAGGKPEYDMFSGHDLFVQVSLSHRPLAAECFVDVLGSPYTELTLEGASGSVARHCANIVVTVSNRAPLPPEALEMMAEAGIPLVDDQPRSTFELKLRLCRQIAGYIARQQVPSVVHWLQSNILISGESFLDIVDEAEVTLLHIHPRLFSPGTAANGKPLVGASLYGAKMLINTEVLFAPAAVPPEYVATKLTNFVDMVRERDGARFTDGDSFGADDSELIRIRHVAALGDAPEHIELTLERADAFDIRAEPAVAARAPEGKPEPAAARLAEPVVAAAAELVAPVPVEKLADVAVEAIAPALAAVPVEPAAIVVDDGIAAAAVVAQERPVETVKAAASAIVAAEPAAVPDMLAVASAAVLAETVEPVVPQTVPAAAAVEAIAAVAAEPEPVATQAAVQLEPIIAGREAMAPARPAVHSVEIPVLRPDSHPIVTRPKITRANAPQARIAEEQQAQGGLLGRLRALLG